MSDLITDAMVEAAAQAFANHEYRINGPEMVPFCSCGWTATERYGVAEYDQHVARLTLEAAALFHVEHTDAAEDVRHLLLRRLLLRYGMALDDAHAALTGVRDSTTSAEQRLTPAALQRVANDAAVAGYHARLTGQLLEQLDTRNVDAWLQRVELAGAGRHTRAAREIVAESYLIVAESYLTDDVTIEELTR